MFVLRSANFRLSIKAAQETGIFDKVFVSTGNNQIVSVSREYDASVHGLRLLEFFDNKTGVLTVLAYELSGLVWQRGENTG